MILCCCHLILPIRFVIWSAPVLGHKTRKYLTQPHFRVFSHKRIKKIAAAHNFVDFWLGKLRIWVTNEMLGKHCNVSYNCKWLQEWPDLWPKLSIQKMKESGQKNFALSKRFHWPLKDVTYPDDTKASQLCKRKHFIAFQRCIMSHYVTLCQWELGADSWWIKVVGKSFIILFKFSSL